MMEQPTLIQRLLRRWYVFVILFILLLVIKSVSNTGFIKLELDPSVNTEATVSIYNQETGKTTSLKSTAQTIKKRVQKGKYEITITRDASNNFIYVASPGLLRTARVAAKLKEESVRTFVGNNPRTCTYMSDQILFSYYCSDAFRGVVEHIPSTRTQPTHIVQNTKSKIDGVVEATITLPSGTFVLLNSPRTEDNSRPLHTLYKSDGFSLSSPVVLSDLSNDESYNLAPFESGFVAYNDSGTHILYYSSVSSKPQKLEVPVVSDTSLKHVLVGSNQSTVVVSRSNKADFQTHDDPKAKVGSVKTEVVIVTKAGAQALTFSQNLDDIFTSVAPCGTNRVCFVSKKNLYVYDVSNSRVTLLYKISDVSEMFSLTSHLMLVRGNGVLDFDVDTKTGYLDYSFGPFTTCGATPSGPSAYIVCIKDKNEKTYALFINQASKNTDSIDKKFAELSNNTAFKAVTLNNQFIFITPEIPLIRNSATNEYEYDPVAQKSAASTISSEIDKLGIDKKIYTIINTSGN